MTTISGTSPDCAPVAGVDEAGSDGVNILRQGSVHLARQCAEPSGDEFRDVDTAFRQLGVPLLVDASAHLGCRVVKRIVGGTHIIFIGEVVDGDGHEGDPLTSFRGGSGRFEFDRDDRIYLNVRWQTLDRRFSPDTVISLDDLAHECAGGKASARYALTRLAPDGLVHRDCGYVVGRLDIRASHRAFGARAAIEIGVIDIVMIR